MKNRFSTVAIIMPPNTVVPTECRPFSPAPEATTSGTTPRMKASEVIRIGRRRIVAACTADSTSGTPRSRSCSANSTIRIAFLLDSPTSMTSPTWQNTSSCKPRSHCALSAPSSAMGTASSTINGSTKLSYWAESVRYTTSVPRPTKRESPRHPRRELFHRRDRLARAESRRSGAINFCGTEQIVVADYLRRGRLRDADQIVKRHHGSTVRAHVKLLHVLRRRSETLVRLHIHAVRPGIKIKIIHVCRAHI